jgi:superkiller protein 3
LYEEVIGHPNTTDDLRRVTEGKLLRHRVRFLHSLSATKDAERKKPASDIVDALVDGVVLLNIPDELAWSMSIEGKDAAIIGNFPSLVCSHGLTSTPEDYDYKLLRRFLALFPQLPLSRFITLYFEFSGIPLDDEKDKEAKPPIANDTEDKFYDLLVYMLSSISTLS